VDGFADRDDRFSGVMVKTTLNLVCNEYHMYCRCSTSHTVLRSTVVQ
jgi:hypothetical protein